MPEDLINVPINEIVKLGALDSSLFEKAFFPETCRQEQALFHPQLWSVLDGTDRNVNIIIFRGGAKTTKARIYIAKRIAYGLSRTVLVVCKSQGHAGQYLFWMRKQVEERETPVGKKKSLYASTFQLSKGAKWDDERIQITHGIEGHAVWMAAYGITGSIRGINFDDYRPDLIIVDDILDEENAHSPEQKIKTKRLVFGALQPGLAPASEAPFAKMVLLNTPQDFDDISQDAAKDKQFKTVRFSCWTPETEDLPIEFKKSSWPARWSDETRRDEYRAALARNELSIFAREYECRLLTPETSTFRQEWFKYFGEDEENPEPPIHEMWCELAIDPVPPPSEKQIAVGLHNKDFEALAVLGKWKGGIYVLETSASRGHDPSWTVNEFFRLAMKWKIRRGMVEGTAYQRTLAWLLQQAMRVRGIYYPILTFDDKQKKFHVITQALKGPMAQGQFFIRKEQETLIHQLLHFPNVKNDDEIEAVARCAMSLQNGAGLDDEMFAADQDEDNIPALEYERGAP